MLDTVYMKDEKFKLERNRDTGLAITLIFGILAVVFKNQVFTVFLLVSLVLTMINPKWCFFFTPVWFGFSHILGTVISKIIFSTIFLLIATPVGVFRRILKYDAMNLKLWKSDNESALVTRNHIYTIDDLKNPY